MTARFRRVVIAIAVLVTPLGVVRPGWFGPDAPTAKDVEVTLVSEKWAPANPINSPCPRRLCFAIHNKATKTLLRTGFSAIGGRKGRSTGYPFYVPGSQTSREGLPELMSDLILEPGATGTECYTGWFTDSCEALDISIQVASVSFRK